MSISAWYCLRNRHQEFTKRSFTGALLLGTVAALGQLASGHFNADMVARLQPAKLAAFEGHFRTGNQVTPVYLFGWPDESTKTVHAGLRIPGLLSLLVHGDARQPVRGLDELETLYGSPPVWLAFQTYHIMVALGVLFVAVNSYACWCWYRSTLFEKRWLLWYFVLAVGLAFAANETGWISTEVGRQPWVVYPVLGADGKLAGGLLTREGVSEVVGSQAVLGSIVMFGAIYTVLFVLWVFLLDRTIRRGPETAVPTPAPGTSGPLASAISAIVDRRGSLSGTRDEGT
jgi:cytochrome d ubiquinol oxidase subunit I